MVDEALDGLIQAGKRLTFIFSADEPILEEFARTGRRGRLERAPGIVFGDIPVRDHNLFPLWAQQQAHVLMDAAVEREIAASGS